MPKTARGLDEQQRKILELEKENVYLKSRLNEGSVVSKQPLGVGSTTTVRNGLVSTTTASNNSPVIMPTNTFDTFTPAICSTVSDYSSYSSSPCDSNSSCDSGSCCYD